MTTDQNVPTPSERVLTPADLHNLRFTRGTMLHPGYVDSEVDRVLSRVAEELGRLYAEKAVLRDKVRSLQAQVDGVLIPEPPSEQAVRILASAQQTADNYVAEAEEFSRQVTHDARTEYEEQVSAAREKAGAIIQAAQETAARVAAGASGGDAGRSLEELQEQVAYLKAFGQACRVQLRSYLEALLSDVENEWGHADPTLLPQQPARPPAQRLSGDAGGPTSTTFVGNSAAEAPSEDSVSASRRSGAAS
jgi:DivIVA domain-containing protein